jgi:hypothetical protein
LGKTRRESVPLDRVIVVFDAAICDVRGERRAKKRGKTAEKVHYNACWATIFAESALECSYCRELGKRENGGVWVVGRRSVINW